MAKRKPNRRLATNRSAISQKKANPPSAKRAVRSRPAGRGPARPGATAVTRAKPRAAKKTAKTVRPAAGFKAKQISGKGAKETAKKVAPAKSVKTVAVKTATTKRTNLDRSRRKLGETLRTPPSSLDMNRNATAARSGRAALDKSLKEHTGMTPELTSGDSDGDWENAYFSGEEAPGGDNPSPDQNVVDDIGKALGVEYQDGEELKASDKVGERDEHRWELDPASAEDYKDRK